MNIGGKAIIIVGMTGSGKSTLVKRLIAPVHTSRLRVYDVNNEYFDDNDELPDIQIFLDEVKDAKEKVIIFEEATIFFSNRGNNDTMRRILVRKRWTRQTIFLIFHSIRSIPYYIYDLCNYVFVLKTNDSPELVDGKHDRLFQAYKAVNLNPAKAKKLKLFNGLYVPYEFVKL